MFVMFRRSLTVFTLVSSALVISACGGGGGGAQGATVEVVKTGTGTGVVSGIAINCGSTCSASTTVGASVSLTATPDAGQQFDGWSGDAASCGSATNCTFTVQSTRAIARAAFSTGTTVSVALAGNNMGTVTSNPAGISSSSTPGSDCSEIYRRGSMVTLTAAPANANNVFVSWGGDTAGCGTSTSCTLMLTTASVNAVATFQPVNRSLTVTKTGSGTVTSSPAGVDCGSDCSNDYQQGSMVTLSAAPASGFIFQGWGGACTGTANCVVTMDGNKAVTATFVSSNVRLTVTKTGNGSGTVTSNPTGISCGTTCVFDFPRGSSVSLTAVAGGNDTFQGWSGGGCSNTGGCTIVLNTETTVTASFSTTTTLGEFFGLTSANRIVSFDRATPGTFKTSVVVTGLPAGEMITAIDTRPLDNRLYGLTSAARLVTIDAVTGAATVKSTLTADSSDTTSPYNRNTPTNGIDGNPGMDFNPVADRLRIVTSTGQNLRVNVDSGAVITDANVSTGAAVTDPAYTFNYSGSASTTLFVIDSASGKLRVQTVNPGQANDGTLTDVGALGVTVTADGGFEIVGSNIDAFAALKASADPATGAFYSIDLRTGAATKIANFGGSDAIIGLAAPVTAAPAAMGDLALLTNTGKLITVNRAAPGTARSSVNITGLPAGETALDIDYRPDATRGLYLLTRNTGSTAKLYVVDPATGATANPVTLSADTTDGTNPYAGLTGNRFSIDFQIAPTTTTTAAGSDRLRIVTDTGLNLSVNPADGKVTTDAAIPASNTIVSTGFTNSFLQAGSTTMYTIDAAAPGFLRKQDPPSGGVQTNVGSLGLTTLSATVGFDIDARNNEGLLAVVQSGTPSLYSVNLETGAATGGTALAGGEPVVGLSIKTPREPEIFGVNAAGALLRFTSTTSAAYQTVGTISGLPDGASVLGMDFRPRTGDLIALVGNSTGALADLYVITFNLTSTPTTATATKLVSLSPDSGDTTTPPPFAPAMINAGNQYAVDFNPVADLLRIVGGDAAGNNAYDNVNLRVNVDTGATTTDVPVGRPPFEITGNAYTNATTPVLYGLDTKSSRLFTINATDGTLTPVGALGLTLSNINGFDVSGVSAGYFAAKDAADNRAKFYSVNLTNGAATALNAIGDTTNVPVNSEVLAMSARTQGNAEIYAVVSGGTVGKLVSFDRAAPGTLLTNAAITGIPTGESIIGMDFAGIAASPPATTVSDVLYLVTKDGSSNAKLYTVNFTTAAATAVTQGATCTNTAGTLSLMAGTQFDVEYTPGSQTTGVQATNGTVRINDDKGLNATINVTCLAVSNTAESAMEQAAYSVTSAAYSNSYAGATTTKLFDLSSVTDSLMLQGKDSPNDGQLFDVRTLNIPIESNGGFDILGGANGYAVGVLRATATNTYSTLYRIDLSGTGNVLTSMGDIGRATPAPSTLVQVNATATRFTP